MSPKVHVSQHALERWRERAAEYATETIDHVIAAFGQATPLESNQVPLKFLKKRCEYYYHAPNHGLFIVGPYRNGRMIITYAILPKPIQTKQPTIVEPKPKIEYLESDPEFRDPQEKSVWLNQQILLIEQLAKTIVNRGRTESDEPVFAYLKRLYAWRVDHRAVLEEAKRAAKLARKLARIQHKVVEKA